MCEQQMVGARHHKRGLGEREPALIPSYLRMNNVRDLTQSQKLTHGVRVAPHPYILMWDYF